MKRTAKGELRRWIEWQKKYNVKYLKTSQINHWGDNNFCSSAMWYARKFAKEENPIIKRISKEEAVLLGFTGNEGIYQLI